MKFVTKLHDLLEHIKGVETETVERSREAHLRLNAFFERERLRPDDATIEAMQYQDILAQQLGATVEAIGSLQECLEWFANALERGDPSAMMAVEEALDAALEHAREQHRRFGGKAGDDADGGVEFF